MALAPKSYVLGEIPSLKDRIAIVRQLWGLTRDILVISYLWFFLESVLYVWEFLVGYSKLFQLQREIPLKPY